MSAVSKYPVEDAGPLILGATLTVTSLALITMVTRLYVRLKMIRNVGWDVSISPTIFVVTVTDEFLGLCDEFCHGARELRPVAAGSLN